MDLLRKCPDTFIILVERPECVNACFSYVPKRYRKEPRTHELLQKLGPIQAKVNELMVKQGNLMVGYQPQGKISNFLRNVISNPGVDQSAKSTSFRNMECFVDYNRKKFGLKFGMWNAKE